MGSTPLWPAPHVPSYLTVQVTCGFGILRSPVAFPLDRQPRQPIQADFRTVTKVRWDGTVTYLTNADRNRQVFQVFIEGDHEPRVHRRHKVVQHPVVLVQYDLW